MRASFFLDSCGESSSSISPSDVLSPLYWSTSSARLWTSSVSGDWSS
jgi:hypothetical protein